MSSPTDRLNAVHDAFSKAYQRRANDLKEAGSTQDAQQILDNLDILEEQYLEAARDALDANGPAVEGALAAATDAQQKVDQAYQDAKALPEKIRLVTTLAQNVKQLVDTATGQ